MLIPLALCLVTAAPPPIKGAKAAFIEAEQLIRQEYVDGGVSDDELWTGAIAGMLERLIQTRGAHKVNALLGPEELRDMQEGMRGSITGVGVAIKLFENVVLVQKAM